MSRIRPKRVIERRKQLRLSQVELARHVGITQQAVNQLEKGETQRPRKLKELAHALECTEDWLLGGDDKPLPPAGVPLISWVQAGKMSEVVDNYQPGDAEDWVAFPAKHSKMIALSVKGTSMNRVSPDGSTIIVDLVDRELVANRLYVFKTGDSATFKRYKDNPPRLEPDSTERHDTIYLAKVKAIPVGRVIRSFMDFE